jgi:hypothetical protein
MNKKPEKEYLTEELWDNFRYEHKALANGKYQIYARAVHVEDGEQKITYLSKKRYPLVLDRALKKRETRKFFPPPFKPKKTRRKKGHQRAFPDILKEMLHSCGYSIHGSEIRHTWKRYLSLLCAEYRFDLLADRDKKLIGSAENLLTISKSAYSFLKSCNRGGLPMTYPACFQHALTDYLDPAV